MQIFTRTHHVTDKALESYALRDLPGFAQEQVADHLSGCEYCCDQLRDVRRFVTILGMLSAQGVFRETDKVLAEAH